MSLTQRAALVLAGLMLVAGAGIRTASAQGPTADQPDKYTWLEDIHGDKSMEWVKAENARTAAVMEKQASFAPLDEAALEVLDSPDKLASPQFRGELDMGGAVHVPDDEVDVLRRVGEVGAGSNLNSQVSESRPGAPDQLQSAY